MEISFHYRLLKILVCALFGMYILFALSTVNISILLLPYILFAGYFFNRRVCAFRIFDAVLLSPLTMSAIISIASAPVLYFSKLNSAVIVFIFFLPVIIAAFFPKPQLLLQKESSAPMQYKSLALCIISLAISIGTVAILSTSATTETTLGPWESVRPIFFIAVFANLCVLATAAALGARTRFIILPLAAFFFSIASITALVYPLGFGFDPLLHNAAIRTIMEYETLFPKTPYYNGYYGLIVFLSKIFQLPPELFSRFLVISIASISIPLLLTRVIAAFAAKKNIRTFAVILAISLLPFSPISSETPWGYAFFLALAALLASVLFFIEKNNGLRVFALILGAGIFAVHPLAGLPMLGFFAVLCFKRTSIITFASPFISAAGVLASFFVLAKVSNQLEVAFTQFNPVALYAFFTSFAPRWEWRFNALLDSAYLFSNNIQFLFLLLGTSGAVIMSRTAALVSRRAVLLLCLGFFGAALSFIFVKGFLSFPSLPVWEQEIYAERIKEIYTLFLYALGLCALLACAEKIQIVKNRLLALTAILVFAAVGTMNVYASYPRNDAYTPYHGYTISRHDIEAVRWIDKNASGKDYVVLANQVTAAASIKEFGFKKYFSVFKDGTSEQIFYYSIPAASPLSDAFINMLSAPSRQFIDDALNATNAKLVYFVIHSYEPRFRNIIDKTKQLADEWHSIDDEKITVFAFEK